MRNLIYGINLSTDGCCDHTKFGAGSDIHEFFTDLMREVDLIVYGRKTYELMVPYWPEVAKNQSGTESENEFARMFTALNKVVFSRSLESAEGTIQSQDSAEGNNHSRDGAEGNTRIVRTNLRDEILKLKAEPGKNISLGGVDLPAQLAALGLIDEFHFVVHPVIVGEGRRLFDDAVMQENLNLKLVNSQTLKSGCIALHYLKQ